MIELKQLSAFNCVAQWRRHKTVDLRVWARPGFNPHPSTYFELQITFVLLILFPPTWKNIFCRALENKLDLIVLVPFTESSNFCILFSYWDQLN